MPDVEREILTTIPPLLGPLFAQAPDAILVTDQFGTCVDANPVACVLLGFTRSELLHLAIAEVVEYPEDWATHEYARLLNEGHWDGRVRLRAKDGQSVVAEARSVVIAGPHGPLIVSFLRDLTERERNDVIRGHLAAIVQSSVDAIVGTTLDGVITDWNPAAQALYGYTAEEAIGRPLSMLHPLDDRKAIDSLLAQVRAGTSVGPFETVHQTSDGDLIDIAITVFPVRDEQGQIVASCGIARDISARVANARALALSESRYRAVVECQSELICRFLPDTTLTFVNEAYCRSFGQPREALLGTHFLDLVPELFRSVVQCKVATQVAHPQRTAYEHEVVLPNGEIGWQAWVDTPILDDNGHLIEIQGIGRDTTEQRRAEAALRQSEVRFRSLISNATDVITILDATGIITYQSPSIRRILGYEPDALIGRNAFELVHDDDREHAWLAFEQAIEDPSTVPIVEFRFQHADGSWHWLEAMGRNLLADEAVCGFVVNSRDVTERRHASEAVHQALEAAHAAHRATSQFLTMMSHEIRTPMQGVLGYAEFLLGAADGPLSPEQREDVECIHRAATRLVTLVKQLMEFSRLEAGQMELKPGPVHIAKTLEDVRQDVAPQCIAKRIALQIALAAELPAVLADPMALYHILLNLVGNAVKFTDSGSVTITARTDGGGVEIEVRDTGIGISSDAIPYIFDEFRQAEGRLRRHHEGVGLGLAIARRLVELQGGQITVRSEPGEGSTFTLWLPSASLRSDLDQGLEEATKSE